MLIKELNNSQKTKLVLVDDLSPEDIAMLQALYSRSGESVTTHLEKVKKAGSGKFMSTYYVGFGHKSIADCGDTTLFIENVSILAAKAIQDWPLYSGQETSTRYIDMANRPIIDPVGTSDSKEILNRWMDFYISNQKRVANTVRQRHPIQESEKEETYERAVKARVFDILRGFLPAGITTQLSWHTNLRQAADHLPTLMYHPLEEVANIGNELNEILQGQYVSSFGFKKSTEKTEWEKLAAKESTYFKYGYYDQDWDMCKALKFKCFDSEISILNVNLHKHEELLNSRPKGCVLPHFMSDLGQARFSLFLDYGSFRDLQRHRNGVCRMPLLTTEFGFESWYLDQMDNELYDQADLLIMDQSYAINKLDAPPEVKQYYIPLGFHVACEVTYGLPAAVYVLELRSGKTVHPTLRKVIHELAKDLQSHLPLLKMHVDYDHDDWDVRRGNQTIKLL